MDFARLFHDEPSPCVSVQAEQLFPGIQLWVKRDDLVHPMVSGNKFRKLKYPLQALNTKYLETGRRPCLVTMGGAWSNHLHATAFAAQALGWPSLALVRADPAMETATLQDCTEMGMQLQFLTREAYRGLRVDSDAWRSYVPADLQEQDLAWLPEGGSDPAALHGMAEMVEEAISQIEAVTRLRDLSFGYGCKFSGCRSRFARTQHGAGYFRLKEWRIFAARRRAFLRKSGLPCLPKLSNHDAVFPPRIW